MDLKDRLRKAFLFFERIQKAETKNSIVFVCVIVLALGLITHGYVFFDAAFTHDSLNALYADDVENTWKISLGRVFKPVYQTFICGEFAVPWLIGCLSLLWGVFRVI